MPEHFSSLVIDELLIAYEDAAAPMSGCKYKSYQEQVELITRRGCENAGSKSNRALLET